MFNPTKGLRLSSGKVQSAALGLAHEEVHAARLDADPVGQRKDMKPGSSKVETTSDGIVVTWETPKEEQRATRVESTIAAELGEPVRDSHGDGQAVSVPTPVFSKP